MVVEELRWREASIKEPVGLDVPDMTTLLALQRTASTWRTPSR